VADLSREELAAVLKDFAERVVGTGDPRAPGVDVEVRPVPEMSDLPGAHPIVPGYDTVASVRVHDEDQPKAVRFTRAIAEALETQWTTLGIPEPKIVLADEASKFDALVTLNLEPAE